MRGSVGGGVGEVWGRCGERCGGRSGGGVGEVWGRCEEGVGEV